MKNGAHSPTDKLVPKQAAEVIGISLRQLAKWREKGIGPAWRQRETRRVYYLRGDIEEWENGHSRR